MRKALIHSVITSFVALWQRPYTPGLHRNSVHKSSPSVRSQSTILHALAALILLVSLCPCPAAPPSVAMGIVIYTDGSKNDNKDAMVFEYYQLLQLAGGVEIKGGDGRSYEITNSKLKAIVPYPGYATLAKSSPQDMAAKLNRTIQTYPTSKRFLQPWLDRLQNSPGGQPDGKPATEQGVLVKLKNGHVLSDCRLKGIENETVAVITHSGGSSRIEIAQLDKNICKALNGTNPAWNLGPAVWGKQGANGSYSYALENGPVLAGVKLKEIKDGKTVMVSHSKGEVSFDVGKLTDEGCKILNGTNPGWNLGPAAWGTRGVNGVYDRFAFANGRVLSSVEIKQVTAAGFKLKCNDNEITVPFNELLLPPASDPIHIAIRETQTQRKRYDEVVKLCKQNDADFWKAESKDFDPLRTPRVTLMVPIIFKFSTVEINDSFQMQSVVAKYNHDKCRILGVGSPVSGEQALEITIRKDVDELLFIPWKTENLVTATRDEFIAGAKRGEIRECGNHMYHVYQETEKNPITYGDNATPDVRSWNSHLVAYPMEKGLPIFDISLSAASSEELARQAPLLLKMAESMIVENSESQLVLKNWEMNVSVSDTPGRLRQPDALLDLLWRQGKPPELLQLWHIKNRPVSKYSWDELMHPQINDVNQLPWLGCSIDQVWANFGLAETRRQGPLEFFNLSPRWLSFQRKGKSSYVNTYPLTGRVAGICDSSGKVIAFEVEMSCYGCVTDADSKEKARDITEDDLRCLMRSCIPSFDPARQGLVLKDAGKRDSVTLGSFTSQHQGCEIYTTEDTSVMAVLDFGSTSTAKVSFRKMRIWFLKPEAVEFVKKNIYSMDEAYFQAKVAEMRRSWKSPTGSQIVQDSSGTEDGSTLPKN
jgi:hypothetical protein